MEIPFRRISQEEWEAIPTTAKPKSPSRWDPILDELETGEPFSIAVESENQARGYRIGLARRASSRGMKLEFRLGDGKLAVRRSSEPYQPKGVAESGTSTTPRRGRRPKGSTEGKE